MCKGMAFTAGLGLAAVCKGMAFTAGLGLAYGPGLHDSKLTQTLVVVVP